MPTPDNGKQILRTLPLWEGRRAENQRFEDRRGGVSGSNDDRLASSPPRRASSSALTASTLLQGEGTRTVEPGFGIYVHWPFCLAKCPYCDFNSHVRKGIDQSQWRNALCADLRNQAELLDERPTVDSVFFGGGTPSLMEGETVGAILGVIANEFALNPDVEITLEANPTSVDWARFQDYRSAGVNRLSLGMQALNDADLKRLGRWHSADEAVAALAKAQSIFDRVSLDLIYARPGQTSDDWRAELEKALSLGTEHLSLYQLTIEPDTPFKAQHDKGLLRLPDDDLAGELYAVTQELCEAAGRRAYEVSNHAKPGAESRHNLVYWRYGEYLGIGPGAHGRITHQKVKQATVAAKKPEDWLAQVLANGNGRSSQTPIDRDDQANEMLLMGLRLSEGIDAGRYARLCGKPINPATIEALVSQGLLIKADNRIIATQEGRLVLNSVIAELAQ